MKKLLVITILFSLTWTVKGQQQVQFTQYMFNQLALNPAYAGIHEGISASFLLREQWVGFEGAPSTQTLSVHSPLLFRPISLGALFVRDKIGITETNNANLMAAYRIKVGETLRLSMGIQSNFTFYNADYNVNGSVDPTLANAANSLFRFNFGTGVMLHSDKLYLGVSTPQFLNQEVDPNNPDARGEFVRHYYISGGYVFPIAPHVLLKPNFLLKAVGGAPLQADLNLNVLFSGILWLGASYRSLDSFDALVQLQITKRFQVGYAFDFFTTTQIKDVSAGSHEIMINYIFELPKTKILTPRYF